MVIGDGAGGFYIGGDFTTVGDLPAWAGAPARGRPRRPGLGSVRRRCRVHTCSRRRARGLCRRRLREGERHCAGESRRLRRLHGSACSVEPLVHRRGLHAGVHGRNRLRGRRLHQDHRGGARSNRKPRRRDRRAVAPTWDSGADDFVAALLVSGDTLFVGGEFSTVNDEPRARLAALDVKNGRLKPWNPQAMRYGVGACRGRLHDSRRRQLLVDRRPGAQQCCVARQELGRCDELEPGCRRRHVDAIAVSGSTAFLGGYFDALAAQSRSGLAAVDLGSGRATSLEPGRCELRGVR